MKYYLYCIYDTIGTVYGVPMASLNNGTALRHFENTAEFKNNPTDYKLYLIGSFDIVDGTLEQIEPVEVTRTHE